MDKALKKQKEEKEDPSLFQRFIFWVLIPLLFAVFLGLLIASIAGVNIFQKANEISEKIPFVHDKAGGSEDLSVAEYEEKMIGLDAEIENKTIQVDQLKKQLENKEMEIDRLQIEQKRLEQTIEELKQVKDEHKRAFKEIVSTYEAMTPKNAASIIMKMKNEEAVKILSNIGAESLAKIMEKMPPEEAAKYLEMLSAEIKQ
ncbi:magnesium transporter MgtE N-terminal domain-containing protein [Lederbergia citrea]|uniref:Magnesium transporter MgtE intracellular domain-containing protein n=1 Tax=Lederbergia citrea TaxID=2833581 RepID=A0A942UKY3_9BACI|nr:hypothetical protein [Lederbergia citrea]MBS4203783.1 hypothetical protein [Lederbergia citrea]MBS4221632.1 hypothetical protein [Lederbergia citrea]